LRSSIHCLLILVPIRRASERGLYLGLLGMVWAIARAFGKNALKSLYAQSAPRNRFSIILDSIQ